MTGRRSIRQRVGERLAAWIVAAPVAIVVGAALVSVVAVAWAWGRVRLDANTDSLMGNDRPYVAEYMRFVKEFGDLEYAWVVVDADAADGTRRTGEAQLAVDLLEARLRALPGIEQVNARVTVPEQSRIATWAMGTRDLKGLVEARDALPLLASDAGAGTVVADARRRLDRLTSQGLFMPREQAEREGAAAFLELEALAAAAPGAGEFIGQPRESEYLVSESGRLLFVGVMPSKDFSSLGVIEGPLAAIRGAIRDVQAQLPGIRIGLTGKPVLQSDEMATTSADMNMSTAFGLVMIMGLIMAVFRGWRLPMLALLAFGAAGALTYAAAAAIYGRLNLLSIVFMLVLIGVGMDYGVFMMARYQEARRHLPVAGSVQYMMRTAVPANVLGALTAAGVFLLAWFTEFQGLRELGIVAGVGLVISLACMVIVLPALFVVADDRLPRDGRGKRPVHDEGGTASWRERPGTGISMGGAWATVAAAAVITSGLAWYGLTHIRFETNLLKLQAAGLESVEWEHRVMDDSAAASWFGACQVASMDEIPPLLERLRESPEIGHITSVLDAVKPDTADRSALRRQLANAVEAAPARPRTVPAWSAADLRAVGSQAIDLSRWAERDAPQEAAHMRDVGTRLCALADLSDDRHWAPDATAAMRARVEESMSDASRGLRLMAEGARLGVRDALPAAIRAQMVSPSGRFLVMVHPAHDVWEPEPLERFVAALRTADPHATGVPMTVSESMKSMARSFLEQSVLAVVLVSLLIWLDLRNARESLAALASLAIGVAWSVGIMAALGATFNLANFFAVPILLGLGMDSVVHITHRAHEGALEHGFGSTRAAVIVTALTTTVGFGVLVFAHHQGLRSLGIAMAVGSLCCLVTAVWVLPAILRVIGLQPKRAQLRLVTPDGPEADAAGERAA